MSDKDYAQITINKIEGGWVLDYRDLGNVHPKRAFDDNDKLLDAIASLVNEQLQ